MDQNEESFFKRENLDKMAVYVIVGSVTVGAHCLAVHLIMMACMNSKRVAMLGPFISSLQIVVFCLFRFKINADKQLSIVAGEMYVVASIDCIPDPILEWLQLWFGEFAPAEEVPISLQYLGIESQNFIVNTGSMTIFFCVNVLAILFFELVINKLVLKVFVRYGMCFYEQEDYLKETVISMR